MRPRVDGEHVSMLAQEGETLVQRGPNNMASLSQRTVIQSAYDDRAVAVGVPEVLPWGPEPPP